MGERRIRSWGDSAALAEETPNGPGSIVEVYNLEESEGEDTVLVGVGSPEKAGRTAPGVPRVLNLEKVSSGHLKWTHLEQVQHCTDLPLKVTFPVHTKQGKMGQGLGLMLPLIKRRRRIRRWVREGQEKS